MMEERNIVNQWMKKKKAGKKEKKEKEGKIKNLFVIKFKQLTKQSIQWG